MLLPQRFILEASLLLLTSYSLGKTLAGQLSTGDAICSIPRRTPLPVHHECTSVSDSLLPVLGMTLSALSQARCGHCYYHVSRSSRSCTSGSCTRAIQARSIMRRHAKMRRSG